MNTLKIIKFTSPIFILSFISMPGMAQASLINLDCDQFQSIQRGEQQVHVNFVANKRGIASAKILDNYYDQVILNIDPIEVVLGDNKMLFNAPSSTIYMNHELLFKLKFTARTGETFVARCSFRLRL